MSKFYLLDENKKPYSVALEESYKLYEDMEMKITARDYVGDILVSTVFLGMNHNFDRESDTPVLWETMVFKGKYDDYMERYTSHEEALAGHKRILQMVKDNL